MKTKNIYKKDWGTWNFKEDTVMLGCMKRMGRKLVYVVDGYTFYGINGAAKSVGHNFNMKPYRYATYPIMIKEGLELCR